ncbi:MAG: UvrABC system protein B [Candidatus Dependentiae bacterium ADurb.Bin331]|nr:MAG: UvrABC system protein B [Candidatus Dependentiae bacterium ADurb.Bin331]
MKNLFKLHSPFKPAGSQPEAIKKLIEARPKNESDLPRRSTLIGVTGSGKTFTIANVIASQNKPVLVLAPNKTLAAQLYEEFSVFFPENKVCYFVSYYDYYQPESYLPAQDVYVPKETKVNSEIERLRVEAAASLVNRNDTIVIASVSCIYSLGNPQDYRDLGFSIKVGQKIKRTDLINQLLFIQYRRNEVDKGSGTIQVFGDTIEVNLPYQKEKLRIETWGDTVESLSWVEKNNNRVVMKLDNTIIFPAKHFVTTQEKKDAAVGRIQTELEDWAPQLPNPLYQERIRQRVTHDIEMIKEVGYCSGIENYSIHFDGRMTGEQPYCLLDFFGKDFLLIIDESHIAIPQLRGMYAGDKARKKSLIDFGFRLPSAADNRPLQFSEIERYFNDAIFVSATPGDYELTHSDTVVEQIIRPTGLLDPIVEVHPRLDQMKNLIDQIKKTRENGFRSLVMVMTKKLAEQLAIYLEEQQIKVCYLHSELKTPQRTEILQKLRLGIFDCIVGVNLLREGIDVPEVALVAIMDADIESFLRDKRSLIQIMGRAARNTESKVLLFADKITASMKAAMDESQRRRSLQQEYNKKHNIIPTTVKRDVVKSITNIQEAIAQASKKKKKKESTAATNVQDVLKRIVELETQMQQSAENFDFEKAIELREEWLLLKNSVNQ